MTENFIKEYFDQQMPALNLLPNKGEAYYFGKVITEETAKIYFKRLIEEIAWKEERLKIAGREITAKRKVAWYGDEAYEYKYSGVSKTSLPWTGTLLILKDIAENFCKSNYNSCLLNFYPNGDSGMTWHSDNESSLVQGYSIACISLGAPRKFLLKNTGSKVLLKALLENGSLFEMKGDTQKYWQHSLPKTKTVSEPRISLTFRKMLNDS